MKGSTSHLVLNQAIKDRFNFQRGDQSAYRRVRLSKTFIYNKVFLLEYQAIKDLSRMQSNDQGGKFL